MSEYLHQQDHPGDIVVADNYSKPTRFCHYHCYAVKRGEADRKGLKDAVYTKGKEHLQLMTCELCGGEIRTQFYRHSGEEEHF